MSTPPNFLRIKDKLTRMWFNYIWMMAHRYKYGWSQLMCGMPGSGKTKTAAIWAWLLDPNFSADDVSFSAKVYIDSLENVRYGSARVWSEMGIGMPSRGWFQLSNILTAQVVQTMRIKRPIILMDVSDLSFIDVQARKLIFHYSEVKRHKDNPPRVWVYDIRINRRTGDIYFPHPLLRVDGVSVKLKSITVGDVLPDDIWKEIDMKQRKFKGDLEAKARSALRMMDEKGELESKSVFDVINTVQADQEKYRNKKGNLDWHLVKLFQGISENKSKDVVKYLEKEMMKKVAENE